jgi:hypothetical protein
VETASGNAAAEIKSPFFGVLMLSALAIALKELRSVHYLSFEIHTALVYFVFLLNAAIAAIGLWTPHRIAWATYLIASVACLILIGASTPISGIWILL